MILSISFLTRFAVLASLIVQVGAASAGVAPENVAIVVNGESEASKTIAEEYARLRGVPSGNVITVTGLPDKEKMSVEDFRKFLLIPTLQALAESGRLPQIDLIAYSADIPTAIDVRGDFGEQKLPKIITPIASVNGLTFMYQAVMAKDIRYLSLNANLYARRVATESKDTPWTTGEQQKYVAALAKWQQHKQALQKKGAADDEKGEQEEEGDKESEEDQVATTALLMEIVAVLEEIQKSHPQATQLHYNRACGLAQLGQAEAAVAALEAAASAGWRDYQRTERDDDLKSLRERDDFKAIITALKDADLEVQPSVGFRASRGWLPNGESSSDSRAPRYLLSTVLACTTGRGMSVDEALENLRRSAAADGTRPSGTIYFERNGDVRSKTREWGFRSVANKLQSMGVNAVVEDGVQPQQRDDVAGAVIGTANFDWSKSGSTILPGAIVEHLTSFGGVMTKGAGQTPLTEFLKQGAAGSSGTVTEPYAIQAKFPSPFLHVHYASGCTLAESFYQSVTGPYQLLIVGDPLTQPWRREFTLSDVGLAANAPLSGEVTIAPKTTSTEEIAPAEWELYVDGLRIDAVAGTEPLHWDTRKHDNGEHVVSVLARGNDRVQTIARSVVTVTVQNTK